MATKFCAAVVPAVARETAATILSCSPSSRAKYTAILSRAGNILTTLRVRIADATATAFSKTHATYCSGGYFPSIRATPTIAILFPLRSCSEQSDHGRTELLYAPFQACAAGLCASASSPEPLLIPASAVCGEDFSAVWRRLERTRNLVTVNHMRIVAKIIGSLILSGERGASSSRSWQGASQIMAVSDGDTPRCRDGTTDRVSPPRHHRIGVRCSCNFSSWTRSAPTQ